MVRVRVGVGQQMDIDGCNLVVTVLGTFGNTELISHYRCVLIYSVRVGAF